MQESPPPNACLAHVLREAGKKTLLLAFQSEENNTRHLCSLLGHLCSTWSSQSCPHACRTPKRWHERPHFPHVCYSPPTFTCPHLLMSLLKAKAPASSFGRKGPSGTQGVPRVSCSWCTPCPHSLATDGCASSPRLLQGCSPGCRNSPTPCMWWSLPQC